MDFYINQLLKNSAKHERILTHAEFETLTISELISSITNSPYHFDYLNPLLIDSVYFDVARIKICRNVRDERDYVFKGNVIREYRSPINTDDVLSMTVKDFADKFAYQAVIINGQIIASHSYQTITDITDPEARFSQELAIRARSLADK